MDISNSPESDQLHPRVLKELSNILATPLVIIFQKSYEPGVLLDIWKVANVVPIFKKGDRHATANYSPVSLISII